MKGALAFTALFLLATIPSQAQTALFERQPHSYQLIHGEDSKLYLYGETCDTLQAAIGALSAFQKKAPPGTECASVESGAQPHSSLKFKVEVSKELSPERLTSVLGKSSAFNGPNCYGFVAMQLGITDTLRFVDDKELTCWLSSSCAPLQDQDAALAGDVGLIETPNRFDRSIFRPAHAFVFADAELVLTKNGKYQNSTVQLQSLAENLKDYGVLPSQGCDQAGALNANCGGRLKRYRCAPDAVGKQRASHPEFSKNVIEFERQLNALNPAAIRPKSALEEKKASASEVVPLQQALRNLRQQAAGKAGACELLRMDSFENELSSLQKTHAEELQELVKILSVLNEMAQKTDERAENASQTPLKKEAALRESLKPKSANPRGK